MEPKGVRKAAVLLRCLPQSQRTALLGRLDPPQAAAVAAEMNALGQLGDAEQMAVMQEFAGASGMDRDTCQPADGRCFQFLHELPTAALRNLVADEQPQAIAVVLCGLPPPQAAGVLAGLPPETQFSVICRIAASGDASPGVVQDVATAIRRRLSAGSRGARNRGVAGVVRILNAMEPAVERRLLAMLADSDPELAQEIRRAMFGAEIAACEDWATAEAVT
jgi:flagellar motor switch protein FliG